jgi:hypothetical protein
MVGQSFFRVVAAALALSTLSFAVGVAGDLSSSPPPNSGTSVVVRIPQMAQAGSVRAAPLIATAAASALPLASGRARRSPAAATFELSPQSAPGPELLAAAGPVAKPSSALARVEPKRDLGIAPKSGRPKGDN